MASPYTKRQGDYLSYIHSYTLLNGRPPAESDIDGYFRVSSAAVHLMMVALKNRGLIQRTPREARSIRLLISPQSLPDLSGRGRARSAPESSLDTAYPHLAAWIAEGKGIEIGYDTDTYSYARVVGEEGVVWRLTTRSSILDEILKAMDKGIQTHNDEQHWKACLAAAARVSQTRESEFRGRGVRP